jgi:hypothetical protein
MMQRSIFAGTTPRVIVKAAGSVTVTGQEGDRITAQSTDRWGLTIESHSEAEIGRARAAVGETVLFDVRIKKPTRGQEKPAEVIEIQVGSGEVWVPPGSQLKVYAGKDIAVQGITGQVDAVAGANLSLQDVRCAGNVSAGGAMHLDCQTLLGDDVELKAGGDIHLNIRDMTSARLRVKDIGGYWEARIGGGEKSVYLKSGGDVTLVTAQAVEALPPNYLLGKIEKP